MAELGATPGVNPAAVGLAAPPPTRTAAAVPLKSGTHSIAKTTLKKVTPLALSLLLLLLLLLLLALLALLLLLLLALLLLLLLLLALLALLLLHSLPFPLTLLLPVPLAAAPPLFSPLAPLPPGPSAGGPWLTVVGWPTRRRLETLSVSGRSHIDASLGRSSRATVLPCESRQRSSSVRSASHDAIGCPLPGPPSEAGLDDVGPSPMLAKPPGLGAFGSGG